jgi:predicted permease
MVLIGYFLKKIGFMKPEFSKAANKLVFRVFLPAMLFLNVYRIENIAEMNFGYALYAVVSLLILTAVMTPVVILFTAKKNQRGVLLQSIFRSNYALIGIPLASALFGEDGIIAATLLSAVIVPVFNVLAVVCLSIFKEGETKVDFKGVFVEYLKTRLFSLLQQDLSCLE